jgi:hypothetical protein
VKKSAKSVAQPFFAKISALKEEAQNCWLHFFIFVKLPKVNSHPIGKNSPIWSPWWMGFSFRPQCNDLDADCFFILPPHSPAGFDLTIHNSSGGDDTTRPGRGQESFFLKLICVDSKK